MTNHKVFFSILSLSASALVMSGCAAVSHPNAMPSGYTHHQETFKSPAPPPSSKITLAQRQYMDAAQAEQFRNAVYDLLTRISHRAGMPPKPVYVLAPDNMTSFYANIDNDLRESMRALGYALADVPTGAYVFAYDAQTFERPRGYVSQGEANVMLTLRVFNSIGENARMLTQESGTYYIQGAELLKVKPATYHSMPRWQDIVEQAEGFEPVDHVVAPKQPVSAPRIIEQPETSYRMPSTQDSGPQIEYNGPARAVVINEEPLSPRSSVSRYMDY
ncbi:MAG: hypothetical protein MRY79_08485 [Alphaproteobacteria bacterium]|nr:hypothetical protein [Alphaproteobacteria bacterium]